jgi:imidazole glycerol-phosphate synthase subunit HisH
VIALVDYGAGNLASVRRAFEAVSADIAVVRDAADLANPEGIVVPGVGHFGATASLGDQWRRVLVAHVEAGRPLLGICLGMQWLFESSEEAPQCRGLGVLRGTCVRLSPTDDSQRLKVPHVGWNQLERLQPSAALAGIGDGAYAYFTHSYAVPVTGDCVAATVHGGRFAAVVERGIVWGMQFHPEKSGELGLKMLRNFVERARAASGA